MGSLCYMGNFEYGERHGAGMMDYGNGIKYEVIYFFSLSFHSIFFCKLNCFIFRVIGKMTNILGREF